jgi:hypothetical protein
VITAATVDNVAEEMRVELVSRNDRGRIAQARGLGRPLPPLGQGAVGDAVDVPRDRVAQACLEIVGRRVAEQAPGLADIGERMANVARAKVLEPRWPRPQPMRTAASAAPTAACNCLSVVRAPNATL